jgi:hypothetical protein
MNGVACPGAVVIAPCGKLRQFHRGRAELPGPGQIRRWSAKGIVQGLFELVLADQGESQFSGQRDSQLVLPAPGAPETNTI